MSLSKPALKRKFAMSTDNVSKNGKYNSSLLITGVTCTEKVAVHEEYNLKRHYTTKHAEYQGDERPNQLASLKTNLLRQQHFFKKANKESSATVEAS